MICKNDNLKNKSNRYSVLQSRIHNVSHDMALKIRNCFSREELVIRVVLCTGKKGVMPARCGNAWTNCGAKWHFDFSLPRRFSVKSKGRKNTRRL